MISPAYYIMGYCTVRASAEVSADVLDICREYGLIYDRFVGEADGAIQMRVRLSAAKRLRQICACRCIEIEVGEPAGLPAWWLRYRRRAGLAVGLLAAVALAVWSSRFVWDVRISGNQTLTDNEILDSLESCGFGVGSSLVGFRADQIENRVLMADGRIAWISINMKGTVANVQVRETVSSDEADETKPCNIIATRSGIVERIELEDGNVVVAAGQSVSSGELLVSGLYDSTRLGLRWTHAKARVYARTVREICVEIPLTYQQKVYASPEGATDLSRAFSVDRSIIFWGKEIKFSKKTGNVVGSCDTIRRSESIGRIGDVMLPITVQTVWYMPYTVETVERTAAQAEELAYIELARQIGEIPGGAEILRKTVTTRLTDTGFFLDCTLVCVEDIAAERYFDIVD